MFRCCWLAAAAAAAVSTARGFVSFSHLVHPSEGVSRLLLCDSRRWRSFVFKHASPLAGVRREAFVERRRGFRSLPRPVASPATCGGVCFLGILITFFGNTELYRGLHSIGWAGLACSSVCVVVVARQ